MYDGVVFAHGFFDWVTVAPLGVRTGAVRLGEGVRSDRGHALWQHWSVVGCWCFLFDDVIFTVMKQSIVAHSEMMANCTIRVIIYLYILVNHYIKGLSKLSHLKWNNFLWILLFWKLRVRIKISSLPVLNTLKKYKHSQQTFHKKVMNFRKVRGGQPPPPPFCPLIFIICTHLSKIHRSMTNMKISFCVDFGELNHFSYTPYKLRHFES
jgi:hypothetical protein